MDQPSTKAPRGTEPAAGPSLGRLVGGYRLERPLGRGGMAEVWLGRHETTRGLAAVKILRPLAAEAVRKLFDKERRAVLRLRHPNIVPIFDVGPDYIVAAYVEGVDLRHRMRSPIAPPEALAIACAIGSALVAAHADGVVHCDVKPGNILLDRSGTPFLADFGIARILDDSEAGSGDDATAGTPAFMAPEQAMGAPTPAADQYALARTLLAMLAGRSLPLHPVEALLLLPAELEKELGSTLARALAIDPCERFGDVRQFVDALQAADVTDSRAPALLAPLERDPARFAWAERPYRQVRFGESITRADYRLSELVEAGLVEGAAAHRFREETGYADFSWSTYSRRERLGPSASAPAMARARETIVLMHGLFASREVWQDVATGIARDNGLAVALTPDLMGFGESPLSRAAPRSACSPVGLVRGLRAWLALIGMEETPTVLLGHSFSAAALMCVRDAELGASVHRICVTPVLFFHSAKQRFFARLNAMMALVSGILPDGLMRPIARFVFRREKSLRRTRVAARDEMAESSVRLGGRRVAQLFWSVANARPAPSEELQACTVVTTHDDPLVSSEMTRDTIRAAGVPADQTYRLVYGGHFPQLVDEERPDWGARNVHELVSVVDNVLDMTRTTGRKRAGSEELTVDGPVTPDREPAAFASSRNDATETSPSLPDRRRGDG